MASRQAQASLIARSGSKADSALHVCVVGGGLAGLACAVAVAQAGARVDLLDERPGLTGYPVHVNVVPNLLRDLVTLGVADDCVRAGFPYRGIRVTDETGRHCFELPTPRLAPLGYPEAIGMAHGDLATILTNAARGNGVQFFWQTRIDAVGWRRDQAVLTLSDGREIAPDLTLLATGVTSPLRRAVVPASCVPAPLGPQWTYVQLPRPAGFDHATLVLDSAGQRAVVVPMSPSTLGLALTPGETAAPLPPVLEPLLARMSTTTPRVARPLLAALMPAPWHRGNLIHVGECAHALPPHFGQSAAQSTEDAIVLKQLLLQGWHPRAIAEQFSERRHARARQVYELVTQAARAQLCPNEATNLRALFVRLSQLVAEPA